MSDVKSTTIDPTDTADLGRRRALARLGLTAAVAYAAPTLLSLTAAKAKEGESGGGDNSGHGGDDSGDDHSGPGGGNSSPSGPDDGPDGPDDNGNDAVDEMPTSPSSVDSAEENT